MITTYAELQIALQNLFADTGNLTASRLEDCITLGEAEIRRRLRIREMEATTDLSVSSRTTALPTDFLAVKRIYVSSDPNRPLQFYPASLFWNLYASSQTGTPKIYTIEAENIVVGPAPDQTYTCPLLYYKWEDALSGSNTPDLFLNHPDLYLYAAAVFAADYLDDDRLMAKRAALFESAVDSIQKADQRDRYPTGGLTMRSEVNVT